MLSVKIQRLQLKYRSGDPLPPLIEITDRIAIDGIKSIEERMETGRFALTASDVELSMVNFDNMIDGEYVDDGLITYIYWQGSEIFRGISYFEDFSFEDAPMRYVNWTAYSWIKRLRREMISSWKSPMNISAMLDDVSAMIGSVKGRPSFGSSYFDLTGVIDMDFDLELGDERPLDGWNYNDVWRDPVTGAFYALKYNADSERIELYIPQGEGSHELIKSWAVTAIGMTIDRVERLSFIRSILSPNHIIAVYFQYRYVDESGRYHTTAKAALTDIDDLAFDYWAFVPLHPERLYVTGLSTPVDAGSPVISDGQHIYTVEGEEGGSIYLTKRTASGAAIGRADLSPQPEGISAIDAPHRDTIVYHDGSRWHWFRWEGSGEGTIKTGHALPEREYMRIYPTAHEDDALCGRYHYYIWRDLPGIADLDEWTTNDPVFILLSAMEYEDTSLEDILIDIAQLWNGQVFLRGDQLHIVNRGKHRGEAAISEDYIENDGYDRTLIGEGQPFLSLHSKGISKGERAAYRTLPATLERFYKQEGNWMERTLRIPLSIGREIGLGFRVIVGGTGEQGIVIARELGFSKDGQMAELTIERRI